MIRYPFRLGFQRAGLSLLGSIPLMHAQIIAFFVPAPSGCAMAHCDTRMSDLARLSPPTAPDTTVLFHDPVPAGKGKGLGCSSNGVFAACTYNDPAGNNLVFYDASGHRLWASGSLLDATAWLSAPMISAEGDVITADDKRVVRITKSGEVVWSTRTPGGKPISPVITASGAVVLATSKGPVSAFGSADGHLIGSLWLQGETTGANYFDTVNTPCVHGNRLYISAQLAHDHRNTGALIAVDVDVANSSQPLAIAWSFVFGSPSGASPLCLGNTIYFDGGSRLPGEPYNPQILAVTDNQTIPLLMWNVSAPAALPANIAADPRGGVWAMFTDYSRLERFYTANGVVQEVLDIPTLMEEPDQIPWSAITIAGTTQHPVMLLGTRNKENNHSYVIGINLASRHLLWKANLAPAFGSDSAPSQFPIVLNSNGKPVVVAAGASSGAYFVAPP